MSTTHEVYTFHVEAPVSAHYMGEMVSEISQRLAEMLDNGEGFALQVQDSAGKNLAVYEVDPS